jgi:hypothetical protein
MVAVTGPLPQDAPPIIGALGGIAAESGLVPDSASGVTQIPVYQIETQPGPANLQQLYGTAVMPAFPFARSFQSGTVTIDDPSFPAAAESLRNVSEEELAAEGITPSTRDMMLTAVGGGAQAVISKAGQLASQTGTSFTSQLAPAARHYLPETLVGSGAPMGPGTMLGGPALSPTQQAASGLAWNEVAVPSYNAEALMSLGAEQSGSPMFSMEGFDIGGGQGLTHYVPMNASTVDQAVAASQIAGGGPDAGFYTGDHITSSASEPGFFGFTPKSVQGYTPGLGQIGLSFGTSFFMNVLQGQPVAKAAKGAAFSTAGMAIGTAVGGPVGGFVGSVIGGMLGSRVICNELWKQGHMSKEMVLDDYRFTRDFLSPQTVRGYHVWAIPVVRQMRKGRFVRLFKHIGIHRGNEIAYIYGKRDKPDYLGKVYRKILEGSSWTIGLFCEVSDWSILYKEKEV